VAAGDRRGVPQAVPAWADPFGRLPDRQPVRTTLPSGRVAEYAYPRYFFSNLSADIRALFCDACERLGIRWTLSNPRNVSVSHRRSVAALDEFVGPKC